MTERKFHDDMLPDLGEEDLASLAEDIRKRGQRAPILADQNGTVIDGRQRLRCFEEGHVKGEPWVETIEVDNKTAEALALTLNTKRRHLDRKTKEQIAVTMMQRGFKDKDIADRMNIAAPRVTELLADVRDQIDARVAEAVVENQRAKSGDGQGYRSLGAMSQRALTKKLQEEEGIKVSHKHLSNVAKDPESYRARSRKTGKGHHKADVKGRDDDSGETAPRGQLTEQKSAGQREAERMRDALNQVSWLLGEFDGAEVAQQLHHHNTPVEDYTRLRRIAGNILVFCNKTDELEE
jgi:ParB-like chromosome segregation protein Spo0J